MSSLCSLAHWRRPREAEATTAATCQSNLPRQDHDDNDDGDDDDDADEDVNRLIDGQRGRRYVLLSFSILPPEEIHPRSL